MMALLLLLLADGVDTEFLLARTKELAARYDQLSSRQTPTAVRERTTVVRELGHLPFDDQTRDRAARLVARVVAEDRSYRVKVEAAFACARVGTAEALDAMVGALFGPVGREPRFELLHAVLPDVLAAVHRPDDLDWIADRILTPAAGAGDRRLLIEAGPLDRDLVVLSLEGVARLRAAVLAPRVAPLARSAEPDVRAAAVEALVALEVDDPAVADALKEPDERLRAAAAGSRHLGWEQAGAAAGDPSPLVRRAAVRGLSARPRREAVALLVARLRNEGDASLRLDLAAALHALTGKDFATDADLWANWWVAAEKSYDGPIAPEPGERAYFFDLALRTSRVTFVIDASASMAATDATGTTRLALAARELERAVSALHPSARFRVLNFSAQVRSWPDEARSPADRTQARAALTALLNQRPGGATNTYAALMMALEDPFAPDTVVLLTDGSPYRCSHRGKNYEEPEQILAEVKRANRSLGVRIHAVALRRGTAGAEDADDEAIDFLRRLAASNRGEFQEIR